MFEKETSQSNSHSLKSQIKTDQIFKTYLIQIQVLSLLSLKRAFIKMEKSSNMWTQWLKTIEKQNDFDL